MKKQFIVNRDKVPHTKADLVKLSKLLIACGFVIGYDGTKKKIPQWLWVLLEDDAEWEAFPWGSVSFQYLIKEVNAIAKTLKGKKKLSYTFKGNTIAFSAWIFEAMPAFGDKVEHKQEEIEKPRFLQYQYKKAGFPTEDEIKVGLLDRLTVHEIEEDTMYWKSLSENPASNTFAFCFDPKKKTMLDVEDDEEEAPQFIATDANISAISHALLEQVAEAAATKLLDKMIEKMKEMFEAYRNDIAEAASSKVLEKQAAASKAASPTRSPPSRNTGESYGHEMFRLSLDENTAATPDLTAKVENDAPSVVTLGGDAQATEGKGEVQATEAVPQQEAETEAKGQTTEAVGQQGTETEAEVQV